MLSFDIIKNENRRLGSNDVDFKVNEMSQFFLDRGYSLSVVSSTIEKVF